MCERVLVYVAGMYVGVSGVVREFDLFQICLFIYFLNIYIFFLKRGSHD